MNCGVYEAPCVSILVTFATLSFITSKSNHMSWNEVCCRNINSATILVANWVNMFV